MQPNTLVTLKIKVLKHAPSRFKKQPYRVHCLCNETPIDIVFFYARHPVVKKNLPEQEIRFVSGKLEYFRNTYQITHPSHIIETKGINEIKNIEKILSETDCKMEDVIKTTIWISDARDFHRFNSTYAKFFPENKPARSTTVCDLVVDAKIEIEVIAYIIICDKVNVFLCFYKDIVVCKRDLW